MKQILLKTWLILVCLLTGAGTMWATDVTLDPKSDKTFPKNGITLSVTDGTLTNGTDYRVYKNQTMTISSTAGNITNISLTYSSASYDGGGWAASYQPNSTSWTSPTANGEQARITKIVVTVSGSTPTKYGITIEPSGLGNTGNGFSVNGTYYSSYQYIANAAAAGETITLIASPKTGYKATADCWNVLQGTTPVSVTGSGNNYSFTMPAGNVSISPVYVAESTPSTPTKLSKPTNLSTANITATSADLSWDAVANASSYELTVLDDQAEYVKEALSVSGTSYNLTGLTASTTYTWSVKAIGDGTSYSDSDDSDDVDFTTLAQGGGDEPSGEETTVTFDNLGYASWGKSASFSGSTYDELSQTKNNVVFDYTRGSGSTYANTTSIRFYKDNQLKFTAPDGYKITSIVWTGSSFKDDVTTDVETCTSTTSALSWSGNSTSVTFTRPSSATSYATLSSVSVTIISEGGTTPDPDQTEKTKPTLSFENATYNATMGEAFTAPQLKNPENVTVSYSSSETGVATVDASTGAISLVAPGKTTITASFAGNETYNEASASYDLVVAPAPVPVTDKTIAEFIEAKGGKCYLTGIVSDINNTTYGNFTLTDESGSIYIYGCLTAEGVDKQFNTLDVIAGDKIKVLADVYEYYNNTTHEAKNVIFVEEIEIEKSQYTVTIETPENGTLVVKEGENVLTSGAQVEEGKTLTIECTPANDDYRLKNWQAIDGTTHTFTTGNTYTVTQDVTIKANFELIPVYTINWSVNGAITSEDLKEGDAVTVPADPDAINGKVFTGWVTAPTVDTDATPAYVTPSATATENVTYYAVFATQTGSAGGAGTIELTNAEIASIYDSKSVSYKEGTIGEWSFKGAINKVSETYYVQMNRETNATKNAYNSHLSTPVCPAPIKSVTINTTNATVEGRTFILTNSATVGAATTDGEGVYGYGSLTKIAGSVTINVTGNPTSLHIYPFGGAVYVSSVVITYGEDATYSDFTTTPTPAKGSFKIGSKGFGTYFTDHAYEMPADVQGGVYTMKNGELELTWLYESGYTVPANEAVLLKGAAGDHEYTIVNDADSDPVKGNLLMGCTEATPAYELTGLGSEEKANERYKFYKLSTSATDNTKYGWYWGVEGGASFTCAANKCVLVLEKSDAENSQRALILIGDDTLTNIDTFENVNANVNIFDLQGRRVRNAQSGIYVVNGKKVIR